MHNHDDKYPSRPGFEPGTPRLQAPVDTNEPSGPASTQRTRDVVLVVGQQWRIQNVQEEGA